MSIVLTLPIEVPNVNSLLLPQRTSRPYRLLSEAHPKETPHQARDRTDNNKISSVRVPNAYSLPSAYSTQSMGPNSFYGKDVRPLRDRNWQADSIRHICNTILAMGFKEPILMGKTFQPPSSKEFKSIFKFIYYQIDPNYVFQKRFEDEFIIILKNLRYPFVDQISKSHLYSVGSMMSWPCLLGALIWMVELVALLSQINTKMKAFDADNDTIESKPENIFFNYLTKAYSLFLSGNDDYEKTDNEFMQNISRKNEVIEKEISALNKTNDILGKEWNELLNSETPISILMAEQSILEADKEKLHQSIMSLKAKKESMYLKTKSTHQHVELHEARISELKKEEARLRETIESQQIFASDVKLMNSQKEQIQRSIEKTIAQIEKVNKESWDQEVLIQKAQDQISNHRQELLRLSPRISELSSLFGSNNKAQCNSLFHIPSDYYTKPDALQTTQDLLNFTQIMSSCKEEILNSIQEKIRLINDKKLIFEKTEWKNASLKSEIKDIEGSIAEINRKYAEEQKLIGRINDTKSKEIEFYKQEVARARSDLHEISLNNYVRMQSANNSYSFLTSRFAKAHTQSVQVVSGAIDKFAELREQYESKISAFFDELYPKTPTTH